MKPETKNSIKETLDDLAIVALCILIFSSLNKKCTNVMGRDAIQKLEEPKYPHPTKRNIIYNTIQRTR